MKNIVVTVVLIILFISVLVLASSFSDKMSDSFLMGWGMDSGMSSETNSGSDEQVSQEISGEEEKEMGIINLTEENFEKEVLKSEKPVLIDFYADWCGPCKMMAPVVEKIAEENGSIKIGKINIDEQQRLAIKYGVMSIPTFIVVKDGEVVNQVVGAVPKSELENLIK